MRAAGGATAVATRLERDTGIALVVGILIGWVAGGWRLGGGVAGGGLLLAISYRPLKRAVLALGPPAPGLEHLPTVSPGRVAVGLVGRYALLLGAAYVIIGRLHLHPLGVLVGVSAVVVAAVAEAVRMRR